MKEGINKKKYLFVFVVAAALMAVTKVSHSVDVGVHGEVWEIAEKDPVIAIQAAYAEKEDLIKAQVEAMRDLKGYSPEIKPVKLQKAKDKKSYLVNTTYTLGNDISDQDGNVVYPAGTVYNVLDYPPFPMKKKYVFFDGANPLEIEYVLSRYANDPSAVFITDGNVEAWKIAREKIGSGLKMLTKELAEVFHIQNTISVAYQSDNNIRVDVIPPPLTIKNNELSNIKTLEER